MTEIEFWNAKCTNLESLFEQMKADTTKKMASILDMTDSAYYPCFRSMFRNVVAALNEARDITLFLKPLTNHFQVQLKNKGLVCYSATRIPVYKQHFISNENSISHIFEILNNRLVTILKV